MDAPPAASARGYLTRSLPIVYLDDERPSLAIDPFAPAPEPFVVRWLGGLEQVLDPVVGLLDNLAWHLDAGLCPDDLTRAMLRWLGLGVAADLDPAVRRRILRRAMALGRRRGTLAGLAELLGHAFGGMRIRVTHSGLATHGADPRECPAAPAPSVVVDCPVALTAQQEHALRRLVDELCPAHVPWTLRIGDGGRLA